LICVTFGALFLIWYPCAKGIPHPLTAGKAGLDYREIIDCVDHLTVRQYGNMAAVARALWRLGILFYQFYARFFLFEYILSAVMQTGAGQHRDMEEVARIKREPLHLVYVFPFSSTNRTTET